MKFRFRIVSLLVVTFVVAILTSTYVRWQRREFFKRQGLIVLRSARNNDFSLMRNHIQSGGNPNQVDEWGLTSAFYAISFSDRDALQFLIDYGSRLKYKSAGIEDNLQNAISAGDCEIIRLVLATREWDGLSFSELEPYFHRAKQRGDSTFSCLQEHFASIGRPAVSQDILDFCVRELAKLVFSGAPLGLPHGRKGRFIVLTESWLAKGLGFSIGFRLNRAKMDN